MYSTKEQTNLWPQFSSFQMLFQWSALNHFRTKYTSKTHGIIAIEMNDSLSEKPHVQFCLSGQAVRIVCAKFKVVCLIRFWTGACQVFNNQKLSFAKYFWLWKLQHQITFKHMFWWNFHLSNFFWNLRILHVKQIIHFTQVKTVNIWIQFGCFPFLISFFCWN